MFVELKAKGLMVGDVPLPEDFVNFDETGFGPAGFGATFQLFDQDEDGRIPRRRNIIVRTGDKHSDFWVSVSLTFFAKGDILPPMVIHEGGGTNSTTIPESIAIGLPADWIWTEPPPATNQETASGMSSSSWPTTGSKRTEVTSPPS